jgi:hypothetical protein
MGDTTDSPFGFVTSLLFAGAMDALDIFALE